MIGWTTSPKKYAILYRDKALPGNIVLQTDFNQTRMKIRGEKGLTYTYIVLLKFNIKNKNSCEIELKQHI